MLQRRLQTQPLDPSILHALENPQAQPAPSLGPLKTAPLQQPGLLLDRFTMPTNSPPKNLEVPAQSSSVTDALNTRLNASESELLLDVSARLSTVRNQDPAAFAEIMTALQQLSSGNDGLVNFSALSSRQQGLLAEMGMTPQNTGVIFKQLYHMLLPGDQGDSSQAFQRVQAKVTSFISNLNLREQTLQHMNTQAKDLMAVSGMVSSLSANSIQSLLKDQTDSTYDLAVSKINSQNFEIKSGMDYTLGHFFVMSQQSPAELQQVEGLIEKVRSDQVLQPAERQALNKYGLSMNAHNKLETLDGKALDFAQINSLQNALYTMKDPTQEYQQVMNKMAGIITQSNKLSEYAALATQQNQQVQQTDQEVQVKTQTVHQLRNQANVLAVEIKQMQVQTDTIADAMNSATGIFADVAIDPAILAQHNIRIQPGTNGLQFFMDNRPASRLEVLHRLSGLMQNMKQQIEVKAETLGTTKVEALKAGVDLNHTEVKLEKEVVALEQTQAQIEIEKQKLLALQSDLNDYLPTALPQMKAEEIALIETTVKPLLDQHIEKVIHSVETVQATTVKTLAHAQQTLYQARQARELLAEDLVKWDDAIETAQALVKAIDHKLKQLPAQIEKLKQQTPDIREEAQPYDQRPASSQSADALDGSDQAAEQRFQQHTQAQSAGQRRNESTYLAHQQGEKRFAETLQNSRSERLRSQSEREQFNQQAKELQKD